MGHEDVAPCLADRVALAATDSPSCMVRQEKTPRAGEWLRGFHRKQTQR